MKNVNKSELDKNDKITMDVLEQITDIENEEYWTKFSIFYDKLSELVKLHNMDVEVIDDEDDDCVINLDYTNQENGDYYRSCFAISRAEFNKYYKKYSIDDFANRYFNSLIKELKKVN